MGNFFGNLTDFRLLLPEVILLKPEHFKQARETRSQVRSEAHQWQIYLNSLALQSFEEWLKERIPNQSFSREISGAGSHLQFGLHAVHNRCAWLLAVRTYGPFVNLAGGTQFTDTTRTCCAMRRVQLVHHWYHHLGGHEG